MIALFQKAWSICLYVVESDVFMWFFVLTALVVLAKIIIQVFTR